MIEEGRQIAPIAVKLEPKEGEEPVRFCRSRVHFETLESICTRMNSKDQVYIFHMQDTSMLRFEKSFSDAVRDPEGDVTRKTGSERYDLNRFAS